MVTFSALVFGVFANKQDRLHIDNADGKQDRLLIAKADWNSKPPRAIPEQNNETTPITHIAFGSCFKQYEDGANHTKILEKIEQQRPDWFFWLGDAAYATTPDLSNLQQAFRDTKSIQAYKNIIDQIPVDGIWDDHDLGPNDADRTVPDMEERRTAFLDFLDVPQNDSRRTPGAGLYFSKTLGEGQRKVKLLFLDTRTFRRTYYTFERNNSCYDDMLTGCHWWENQARNDAYRNKLEQQFAQQKKNEGGDKYLLLGATQHRWLKQQLVDSDAQVHVLISSIQFFSTSTDEENWMHWHTDRKKLFKTLKQTDPSGLIFLSGDVHRAEEFKVGGTYMEMTSSGINRATMSENPMPNSVLENFCGVPGMNYCENNFGMLEFDWEKRVVKVEARGEDGNAKLSWERKMDEKVAHKLNAYRPTPPASVKLSKTKIAVQQMCRLYPVLCALYRLI